MGQVEILARLIFIHREVEWCDVFSEQLADGLAAVFRPDEEHFLASGQLEERRGGTDRVAVAGEVGRPEYFFQIPGCVLAGGGKAKVFQLPGADLLKEKVNPRFAVKKQPVSIGYFIEGYGREFDEPLPVNLDSPDIQGLVENAFRADVSRNKYSHGGKCNELPPGFSNLAFQFCQLP